MKYYEVKKECLYSWTCENLSYLVLDENELARLATQWGRPIDDLLAEVEELAEDDTIVSTVTGEPVMSKWDYSCLIDAEMREWWENADESEREDYGSLENYLSSARDEWIAEDQQYTYLPAWRESHERESVE